MLIAMLLILALPTSVLLAAGCARNESDPPQRAVAARIGSVTVTAGDVDNWHSVGVALAAKNDRDARKRALRLLIQGKWIEAEATRRGIRLDPRELRQVAGRQRSTSKMSNAGDLMFEARLDLNLRKIRQQVMARVPEVRSEAVRDYYRGHPQEYYVPQHRAVVVVTTRGSAEARKASRDLHAGVDPDAVAARYKSGRFPHAFRTVVVAHSPRRSPLDQAVLTARSSTDPGAVRLKTGFAAFRVQSVTPARRVPLAEAEAGIRRMLLVRSKQATLTAWVERFTRQWRSITSCDPALVVEECGHQLPE